MKVFGIVCFLLLSLQINARSKTIDGNKLSGPKMIGNVSLFNTKVNGLRIFFAETEGSVNSTMENVTKVILEKIV